jgi:hypothetical protein
MGNVDLDLQIKDEEMVGNSSKSKWVEIIDHGNSIVPSYYSCPD